jgi:hypothetical protein
MSIANQNVYTTAASGDDGSWQNVYSTTSVVSSEYTNSGQWYQTTRAPVVPDFGPIYQTTNAPIIPDATTSIPSMYQTTMPSSAYQTVYSNNQPAQSRKNLVNETVSSPIINNIYQSSGILLKLPKNNSDKDKEVDEAMGHLGGTISESKTEVQFPDDPNPLDSYSYYGALKPKGGDFVPLNTSVQTNDKMLDRMLYTPPPLPPNFEYSYYGALRSKGSNFIPLNSSAHSAADPEKILNEDLYQKSLDPNYQDPNVPTQTDFAAPAVSINNQYKYNNTPIDVYSQFGALRNKNG